MTTPRLLRSLERTDATPLLGSPWFTVAWWALVIHAAANAISAVSFATFLVEPYPGFLSQQPYLGLLTFGLKWGGQITVVLGAVAGFAFAARTLGTRPTTITFTIAFVLTLLAELAGTRDGLIFGDYAYSDRLGYKILDLVPYNIPASWFYMIVAGFAIASRLAPAKDDFTSKWWWAFIAGFSLTAWDVLLDPAMVKTYHWIWRTPDLSAAPAWQRFIGEPIFYGMPITNSLGWLFTATVVSRAMLAVVPPSAWARALGRWQFPLALYGINALLPLAICLRQEMVPAAILGSLVMGVPLWLAWRAPAPAIASAPAGAAPRAGSPDASGTLAPVGG